MPSHHILSKLQGTNMGAEYYHNIQVATPHMIKYYLAVVCRKLISQCPIIEHSRLSSSQHQFRISTHYKGS